MNEGSAKKQAKSTFKKKRKVQFQKTSTNRVNTNSRGKLGVTKSEENSIILHKKLNFEERESEPKYKSDLLNPLNLLLKKKTKQKQSLIESPKNNNSFINSNNSTITSKRKDTLIKNLQLKKNSLNLKNIISISSSVSRVKNYPKFKTTRLKRSRSKDSLSKFIQLTKEKTSFYTNFNFKMNKDIKSFLNENNDVSDIDNSYDNKNHYKRDNEEKINTVDFENSFSTRKNLVVVLKEKLSKISDEKTNLSKEELSHCVKMLVEDNNELCQKIEEFQFKIKKLKAENFILENRNQKLVMNIKEKNKELELKIMEQSSKIDELLLENEELSQKLSIAKQDKEFLRNLEKNKEEKLKYFEDKFGILITNRSNYSDTNQESPDTKKFKEVKKRKDDIFTQYFENFPSPTSIVNYLFFI